MKPDIFGFDDYRSFLQAACETRKQAQRSFNLAAWARKLSLKSSSTLIMILNGTRNPSAELTESLVQDLGLNPEEAEHFRNLVQLEKSKTNPHLRAMILDKMPVIKERPNSQLIKMKYFRLISEWYFMAIRELVDLPDFQEDSEWIQSRLRFRVTKPQIEEAIEVLVQCGLLARGENGKLQYTSSVATTFDVPNEDIQKFHKGSLELMKQAVDQVPAAEREMLNSTFTCRAEDLPLIKKRIRDVLKDLAIFSDGPGDSVFMLQVGCVPVTNTKTKKTQEGSEK